MTQTPPLFASLRMVDPAGGRVSTCRAGGLLAASLALTVGCTQDYGINTVDPDDPVAAAPVAPTIEAAPVEAGGSTLAAGTDAGSQPGVVDAGTIAHGGGPSGHAFDRNLYAYELVQPSGDAVEASEDAEQREREELYELTPGLRTSVVDFLFVVDNSTSMGRIRDLVRSGLVGLYDDDPFPADARIAVMSTIPADPADFSRLHPRVNNRGGQEFEPGFLKLVDAKGIEQFKKESPVIGENFRFSGCENAWFEPWEENDEGVPCMVAHTQISRTPVRVEAGLSAFQQFMQKQAGTSTFREGAAVHVIFVSDTHSPGLSGGQNRLLKTGLEVDPITYADLQQLVDADNLVSSFKVHAIAPATECVEEWAYLGPRYYHVAEAAGGQTLDICTAEDYSSFIRDLVEDSGIVDTPIFELGRPMEQVHEVLVDGQSVAFDVVGDGTAVRVKGLKELAADRKLTVRYRY